MAAAATAIGGLIHGDASFAGLFGDVRSAAIIVVLQVTMAAAFGALAAQTAVALVAYLVAPLAWAILANGLLERVAPWFDVFAAYDQLGLGPSVRPRSPGPDHDHDLGRRAQHAGRPPQPATRGEVASARRMTHLFLEEKVGAVCRSGGWWFVVMAGGREPRPASRPDRSTR